jgi:receptor-type tyrosine-protein phosphatase beta
LVPPLQVKAYAFIVAEDYSKPTDNKLTLPKWQDVQQFRTWPPYQASDPYDPFNDSSVEDFTVGMENCEGKVGYCNGPLKPGGIYRFKIRAYTTRDQFSETNWSQPIQTDPDNTAFLVGIIIPIILLVLVALVVLGIRRLRSNRYENGESGIIEVA